jgi:hypothetical protein
MCGLIAHLTADASGVSDSLFRAFWMAPLTKWRRVVILPSEPPRPKVGVSGSMLIKHFHLILRKAMALSIIPYHLISDLLSHCSVEIPLLPKVTAPKLLFHVRKLLENLTAGNALQNSHHTRNRIPRWERDQRVPMILDPRRPHSGLFQNQNGLLSREKLFNPWANSFNEYLFSMLRAPHL